MPASGWVELSVTFTSGWAVSSESFSGVTVSAAVFSGWDFSDLPASGWVELSVALTSGWAVSSGSFSGVTVSDTVFSDWAVSDLFTSDWEEVSVSSGLFCGSTASTFL